MSIIHQNNPSRQPHQRMATFTLLYIFSNINFEIIHHVPFQGALYIAYWPQKSATIQWKLLTNFD